MRRWSASVLCAGAALLTACGAVTQIPEAQPAAERASATPLPSSTLTPGAYVGKPSAMQTQRAHIDLSRPGVGTFSTCGDYGGGAPATIAQELADPYNAVHVAAVVTVDAVKAPIYNTPDGQRWTQAWYDAGHDIDIYTPYVVTVNRVVSGSGASAGQRLTVYAEGGQMPNRDFVRLQCNAQPTVPNPQPGAQAVMGLGGSIPGLSAGPTVAIFDVIRDGKVVMAYGPPQDIP